MRFLLALFCPFSLFFTIRRPTAGVLCLLLELTVIGWIPAALWALYALNHFQTDQKIQQAVKQSTPRI